MIYLTFDPEPFVVPYRGKPDKGIGNYVDLGYNPEDLDQIPELRESRALTELVVALNRDGTGMQTIACGIWSHEATSTERPNVAAYVEFTRRRVVDPEPTWAYEFFHGFAASQPAEGPASIGLRMLLRPLEFRVEQQMAWALSCNSVGEGENVVEATERAEMGLGCSHRISCDA